MNKLKIWIIITLIEKLKTFKLVWNLLSLVRFFLINSPCLQDDSVIKLDSIYDGISNFCNSLYMNNENTT